MVDIKIEGPSSIPIEQPDYAAAAVEPSPVQQGPSMFVGTDGKIYNVPAASYNTAIKEGWKPATREDIIRENTIKERIKDTGQLEGGLKTFANEALFGIPNYISNKNAGPQEAAIDEAVRTGVAERDPITHGLATAAGFVAPLAIPGIGEAGTAARGAVLGGRVAARGIEEIAAKSAVKLGEEALLKSAGEQIVAKAAEASLGRKIAAETAKYATEGAIYSSPSAAVQVAYGDTEQAAETMLWGIGLTGLVGGAVGTAGVSFRAASKYISKESPNLASKLLDKQPSGLTYSEELSRKLLGVTDEQANRLGADTVAQYVAKADEIGLLKSNSKFNDLVAIKNKTNTNLAEHYYDLEKHLKDLEVGALTTLKPPATIGNILKNEINEKFSKELTFHEYDSWITKKIETFSEEGGGRIEKWHPSFKILQDLKTGFLKEKSELANVGIRSKVLDYIDQRLKNFLETGAQEVYTLGKSPEKFADYTKQKFINNMASELTTNINQFEKTSSTRVGLASLLGYAGAGGITGAIASDEPGGFVAGALAGGGLKGAGSFALKMLAKNHTLRAKGIDFIKKLERDPSATPIIGGLMAKEGQAAFTRHLDTVSSFLTNAAPKITAVSAVNAFQAFLGDEAKGLSKEQQFKRTSDHINSLVRDHSITADHVGHISSEFAGTSVVLASLVAAKKLDAIAYLASTLPKNPNAAKPFQKDDWKANKQDRIVFESRLAVVQNPMSVWHKIQNHTIIAAEVETLMKVYPKLYQSMVQKTAEIAYQPEVAGKVSHKTRLAVSKFTGMPLDNSLKNLVAIQKALQPREQEQQSSGKSSSSSKQPRAKSLLTDTQRRTYGEKSK